MAPEARTATAEMPIQVWVAVLDPSFSTSLLASSFWRQPNPLHGNSSGFFSVWPNWTGRHLSEENTAGPGKSGEVLLVQSRSYSVLFLKAGFQRGGSHLVTSSFGFQMADTPRAAERATIRTAGIGERIFS